MIKLSLILIIVIVIGLNYKNLNIYQEQKIETLYWSSDYIISCVGLIISRIIQRLV